MGQHRARCWELVNRGEVLSVSWDVAGRKCISCCCIQSIIISSRYFGPSTVIVNHLMHCHRAFYGHQETVGAAQWTLAANQTKWRKLDSMGRKDDKGRQQCKQCRRLETPTLNWCTKMKRIHYPLLISPLKIISQREKERERWDNEKQR